MQYVSFHLNQMNTNKSNHSAPTLSDTNLQRILDKHAPSVSWIGKTKESTGWFSHWQHTIFFAQPQRRTPFHLRHKVESEIQKLKREDIIEKIPEDTPTDWVSPVVIVPRQDNNIRLCGDIRAANTAIKRTRHPIPTVEAVSLELNGASIFSKLDLLQAYH